MALITPLDEATEVLPAINQRYFMALSLRYRVLPLTLDETTLTLVISEQSDIQAVPAFRFVTGKPINTIHWDHRRLQAALAHLQAQPTRHDLQQLLQQQPQAEAQLNDPFDSLSNLDHEPLIQFINSILHSAIAQQASDIHFEPYATCYRVRFRIDGVLHESPLVPPPALAPRIAARLKIISGLNIAECRLPQDGRFTMPLPGSDKTVALRVATLPTRWGEKVVLRLLDGHQRTLTIEQLGMPPRVEQQYRAALTCPQGVILITGPTGSGKTITLYSGLQHLNQSERNICTAEDPIEIPLMGINQVQIHPKAGLTFEIILRALLRQDPDVIMLGEIRDQITADMAIKAAQTGHLVLSTLHTNSAAAALTRLQQLGVARYQLASAITLIIAQRLLRRLCPYCRSAAPHQEQPLPPLPPAKTIQIDPEHCPHCHGGYQGRVGLYEALVITPEIAAALLQGASDTAIMQLARQQGMQSLAEAARPLLLAGVTTTAELQRVLGQRL
jgi:type II secretory ATPase GspE/PulE/Tfp pilus assembly ATPase PilB-like protein